CRKFNFELQAAATEDNIILSLTSAHSFELAEAARYLHSASVRNVLVQALLDAPMFNTRWRWVAGISLALPRFQGGKKVPPQFTRMQAEDLVGAVFPDQIACAENLVGEREVPDHPLVNQTIWDCLHEAMDIDGLERLLSRIEGGEVAVVARRWMSPEDASELGRLDAEAIARVRSEAWPDPTNEDELHDALQWLSFLSADEAANPPEWGVWLKKLANDRRAVKLTLPGATLWVAAERQAEFAVWPRDEALVEIVRGRLEGLGPVTEAALAASMGLKAEQVAGALMALQAEGFAMRGRFTPGTDIDEWCDRRLLARIHHYTIRRLRAEIEPVAAKDFLRFLFAWQRVTKESRLEGPDSVAVATSFLEGYEAAAGAWETEILPARIDEYDHSWLDDQCLGGNLVWARLTPAQGGARDRNPAPVRSTPITLMTRRNAPHWTAISGREEPATPSARAQALLDSLRQYGASFFDE